MPEWSEPRRFDIDVDTGLMVGSPTRYQKRLTELAGMYADAAAYDALVAERGAEVVYDVTDHRPSDAPGDLITGVTRMSPGKVGNEFFLTRGHLHARADRPELYFGLKGKGLMLMESPDGETRVIDILPNTVCYVAPHWIHRSINVGDDDFVMLFCYPADSGQDYGIIERAAGMRLRIVDDGAGGWRSIDNPAWVARTPDDIAQLLATTGSAA